MTNTATILTIKSPGNMTKRGRRDIAAWLRRAADDLEELGADYTEGRFIARYYCKLPDVVDPIVTRVTKEHASGLRP